MARHPAELLPFVGALHLFEEIDSTNTFARGLGAARGGTVVVVLARRQTAGRGQRGNVFHSALEGGLWLSVVVTLDDITRHFRVNQSLALGACAALRDCAGLSCRIKWPNDIMSGERKIGGILLETATREHDTVVAGIGINVNTGIASYPDELRGIATSVVDETGTETDLEQLTVSTLTAFHERLTDPDSHGVHDEYVTSLYGVGRTAAVQDVVGVFEGVDDHGRARVSCDGSIRRLYSGPMRFVDEPG